MFAKRFSVAKDSKIEWTDHTFNPWWGCVKVSPACRNCYAEKWAVRVGSQVWGAKSDRRFFKENHWKEPLKWNREAKREGSRRRVFCASMADVFESRSDLVEWRRKLWDLILQTQNLDWLLLTKRPHNVSQMVPKDWLTNGWPPNVWLGTSVENQRWAEERIPLLLENNASVKFLSCEPLLGNLDLSKWMRKGLIDWVIAGGESGAHSRPMSPHWVRSLRDQCQTFGVAFHFKQWGHWAPSELLTEEQKKTITIDNFTLVAAGKKRSGRSLDGRTWDEFPKSA